MLQVRPNPEPTAGNITLARGFPFFGMDARDHVKTATDAAAKRLKTAIVQAGSKTWRSGRTTRWTPGNGPRGGHHAGGRVELQTAFVGLDRIAGRDVVHPVYLDDSPIEAA